MRWITTSTAVGDLPIKATSSASTDTGFIDSAVSLSEISVHALVRNPQFDDVTSLASGTIQIASAVFQGF
jgi:hypothetical protein